MHADLAMMHWNTQPPGKEIKPKAKFHSNANLLPQLELLWQRNLERIAFRLRQTMRLKSQRCTFSGTKGGYEYGLTKSESAVRDWRRKESGGAEEIRRTRV